MNLFVYGTLTFPEIVQALTHNRYKARPAYIENYLVTSLEAKPYPGMIEVPGATAEDWLLYDLEAPAIKILDAWEGREYVKKRLSAITSRSETETFAYVWRDVVHDYRPWDRDRFKRQYLDSYLLKRIPLFTAMTGTVVK